MDSGEYESTKRTGTFDRRLFDNKVFKLELKPLAADASLDQVNKFIEEFGEAVASQRGGVQLQTFFNFYCGIKKPSTCTTSSGVLDDDIWNFKDDPESQVLYPDEGSELYVPSDTRSVASSGSKSNIYEKRTIHAKYRIPVGYSPGDFTDEAMELDRYMYAAFTNLLKGSHRAKPQVCGVRHLRSHTGQFEGDVHTRQYRGHGRYDPMQ